MSSSERLDVAIVSRGLAHSRTRAADLVKEGHVRVDGEVATKRSLSVSPETVIEVAAGSDHWVSRAAQKLAGYFASRPRAAGRVDDRNCLDIGASTGGFTQVLLEHGARRVVALDVGHSQLDPRIATDPRVTVLEGVNARFLDKSQVVVTPDIIVIDVSFISLRYILPGLAAVAAAGASIVALVKPQFEVGKEALGAGGIVRRAADRRWAVESVLASAFDSAMNPVNIARSTIDGANGNAEYFVEFELGSWAVSGRERDTAMALVDAAFPDTDRAQSPSATSAYQTPSRQGASQE
ncbi:TlyA family RNA methyltransferase [Rarobacter incanus]|uniref:23S rRNA (Cytidine1920-2'-O)/16S rRNA (Cytidine1409-2'-O)-methyltransferase n=1 Tax=Rarobacter incanus TaxID=153494 RepID=A0A542SLP2_9MICO|nr:TlyA family RNA methyltransferase [Rarobacter incanus]TQK75543.1 23S rRNA (cytidine1920-2'-O)/16S rRNA (cytidine1409-2'-O)-methyltransferase [Rarobacter incanus]